MINAGIKIAAFNGKQSFDSTTKQWVGIEVKVNYPGKQNETENPIQVGDLIIEPGGNVWLVDAVAAVAAQKNTFDLTVSLLEGETTETESPGLGSVARGGVITPKKGYVSPHWDTTVVDANVSRIASMITMDNFDKLLGGGTDTGGTGGDTNDGGGVWVGHVDMGVITLP